MLANASYGYSTEDEDENKRDQVTGFLKPSYALPFSGLAARKQEFQLTLGIHYVYGFNHVEAGESVEDTDNLFTIRPGIHYIFNGIFSAELQSHFSLSGQSQPATNGVELKLHFTLEESLYNAISG